MVNERWTKEKAWEWYHRQPWLCGFNFIPSTAVNSTEMWQSESFDPGTINRELGWAASYGYNSCRVFLQFLVWLDDREGYKKRVDRFLNLAHEHQISTILVLFDDCAFSNKEPYLGKQDFPIPCIQNSGWTPSPGSSIADNSDRWADLKNYVQDIINSFSGDFRVLLWDVYNEPGNSNRGEKSLNLLKQTFNWARETNPIQPVTSGIWGECDSNDRVCIELSDIITFHNYDDLNTIRQKIGELKTNGYPLICTEWMARHKTSCFATHLPLFNKERIGCYQWGMVNGKTQTHLPWGSNENDTEPEEWFHDVLLQNGAPYRSEEMEMIQVYTGRKTLTIDLKPVEMTKEIMQELENKRLIYRICPSNHSLNPKSGETLGESIYECEAQYGPHKLITVTVNRSEFAAFGTHPDTEDFLLIGDPGTKPLYLVIALCLKDELERKIREKELCNYDFITLRVKYNDPEVSFFSMLKNVPHGEVVASIEGKPASFYVTESRDLRLDILNLGSYSFILS